MKLDYNNFISRNSLYIDSNTQRDLKSKKIFFAGCGLGSVIAESAVRTGFSEIILADGDNVELSNLNRQYFFYDDLRKNKAKSLARNLRRINPIANINVNDYFIDSKNIDHLLKNIDFVINTVDLDATYFSIINKCLSIDVPVICPFNIGFGGVILVFNKNSVKPEYIWGEFGVKNSNEFYSKLLTATKDYKLPNYVASVLTEIFNLADRHGYYPQISIGAHVVSALVLSAIIKILKGQPIALAPHIISIDSFSNDGI
ncbi:MAG: ThiF family adenylyltransferase [bacterium]|nr:ThiF family adenylyltransferase [bacterium]